VNLQLQRPGPDRHKFRGFRLCFRPCPCDAACGVARSSIVPLTDEDCFVFAIGKIQLLKSGIAKPHLLYRQLADQEWPIVSLAGGVYAGQLHALFELVGPKVAYFLGGAVALHRKGPVQGAALCAKILAQSAKQHREKLADVPDLPRDLIEDIEHAYDVPPGSDPNTFHYVPPRDLKAEVPRW
jgi:hypothetical protein